MKYHYCELTSINADYLYKEAEFLESIGYQVVGNGMFYEGGIYTMKMRKAKEVDLQKTEAETEANKLYKTYFIVANIVSFILGAMFVYLVL